MSDNTAILSREEKAAQCSMSMLSGSFNFKDVTEYDCLLLAESHTAQREEIQRLTEELAKSHPVVGHGLSLRQPGHPDARTLAGAPFERLTAEECAEIQRLTQDLTKARENYTILDHWQNTRCNQLDDQIQELTRERDAAQKETDRIKNAIWPGLPKFVSTPDKPKQDFHEALIESFRTQHENDDAELSALRAELETAKRERNEARTVVGHIMKRLDDEYGVSLDEEWVQRVANGEHDVPFPESSLRVRLEEAERDELHEIGQRDYREEKFGELVAIFGDVQLEFSNLRGFDEIIADCAESLKVRNDAIARAYERFRKIATFIPDAPQSHEDTLEQVTILAADGETDIGDVVSEWERINGEIYPNGKPEEKQ